MSKLQYRVGDATQPVGEGTKIIAHCCNNVGAWGAGFVLALSKRWPQPEAQYKGLFKDHPGQPPELGTTYFVRVDDPEIFVANIIGQRMGGTHPVSYDALWLGLHGIRDTMGSLTSGLPVSLHMPRMGSALAGGSWDVVEAIVNEVFEDTDFTVTCYDLKPIEGTPYALMPDRV